MDVLGVKASHLNLSGAPGGIVEKIRRQHSSVWFLNLLKATAMLISPHHTGGKHIALAGRQEAHAHESARVCVQGVGENRMPGRLPISTPSTDSSVSIHQLSVWELPTRIWYQTEERKKQPARTIFALSQQKNHKLVCLWRTEWTEAVRGNRVFTCIWRRVADP